MLGFNITAQELTGCVLVVALGGVLIETTISGIRAEKKKQQMQRPKKNKKTLKKNSSCDPA